MREQTVKIFTFSELSDEAKETAIEGYRAHGFDYEWWDCTFDDAKNIAALMGIEIEDIYFSGFSSQGDGACFTGSYQYKKGSVKAVKSYAPTDTMLHSIAEDLQKLQKTAFYGINATIKHSGHYYHEYCTHIEYDHEYGKAQDDAVTDSLRDLMRWIYKQLQAQDEYQNSNESITETIEAREYEFDADGSIV